jgi:hypothetical protein
MVILCRQRVQVSALNSSLTVSLRTLPLRAHVKAGAVTVSHQYAPTFCHRAEHGDRRYKSSRIATHVYKLQLPCKHQQQQLMPPT